MILQGEENKGVERTGDGERKTRRQKLECRNEESEVNSLDKGGNDSGGEVNSPDKVGIFDRQLNLKVKVPKPSSTYKESKTNRLIQCLSICEPALECSPYHVGAEGTVGLDFIEAAATLSVGRSALAEESKTA